MSILGSLSSILSVSQFGFNILDIVIVVIILFYAYEGYALGFLSAFVDLLSFILSFILGLKFYTLGGHLITHFFQMPGGFSNALGFFLIALLSEIILNIIFRRVVLLLPHLPDTPTSQTLGKFNHIFGLIPGIISAMVVLSFILTVVISLPSSPVLKNLVASSRFGSILVDNTAMFDKNLNTIFGGALHDSLNFLTVEPKSDERVPLHFTVKNGQVDPEAEQTMFMLVNKERTSRGLAPLVFDDRLRDLARTYSSDMFSRGYFSHYNPEGQSPFDRMANAGITYQYAGENLALASSTDLAMQGLMNSPGHKANILNVHFGKIGIGVVDGGIYGMMFTQEFTD